jgi:hypothetical protein
MPRARRRAGTNSYSRASLFPNGQDTLGEDRIHIVFQKTLYLLLLQRNSLFQFGYSTLARFKLRGPIQVDHSH